MDWQLDGVGDYFGTRQITETWRKGNGQYKVTFWRRPLSVMLEEIRADGFTVDALAEPAPLRELESISPSAYRTLTTKPRFLSFRLHPVNTGRDSAAVACGGEAPPNERSA
jgi:hypothetical protein